MSQQASANLPEPATSRTDRRRTEVGSVFVSNYPPYAHWGRQHLPAAHQILDQTPADPTADLGLYLHIPFCRKRCKFCYFRVYTDKNSKQIQRYLDALVREVELYAARPATQGRRLRFVYFGGGTPSYISARHLRQLAARLQAALAWDRAEEVAFECEPGTLTQAKVAAIAEIGVTRLSLGLENMNDDILRENGRAHTTREIRAALPWVQAAGFRQVNVDLIAGMVGETWERWRQTVQQTIDLDPDSVTVYQMELPYNTVYSKQVLGPAQDSPPLADWQTKREWHAYAFEQFAAAGYQPSSAYTVAKKDQGAGFVYRDAVWQGADMLGCGVASFSHMQGVHYQNSPSWDHYLESLESGALPLERAYPTTPDERLVREMILQLKRGRLDAAYFRAKFGVELADEFGAAYASLQDEGLLTFDREQVRLTLEGLLMVDQLLPDFYDPRYRDGRYA